MHCATCKVTGVLEVCLQHLQEQKNLVFFLWLGIAGTTLVFWGLPSSAGLFWSWRPRKMVRISDHMTCEERLRDLSLCRRIKRRVRGDVVTVCSNLTRTATKVMVPNPSQLYHMMWQWEMIANCRVGDAALPSGAIEHPFLEVCKVPLDKSKVNWSCLGGSPALSGRLDGWPPEVPFRQSLCSCVVFAAVLRLT